MVQQASTLLHVRQLCKLTIVLAEKYRWKIVCNQYRESVGKILRRFCFCEGVKMTEINLRSAVRISWPV